MAPVNLRHSLLVTALLAGLLVGTAVEAQQQTVGLLENDEGASPGYNLFKRRNSGAAYLVDTNGFMVHSWNVAGGNLVYLLENGNLLRGPGRIIEYDWDGTIVWDYTYDTSHHDFAPLPNGNVLLVTRETISGADAIAAGRDPALLDGSLRPLHIVEIEKSGPTSGTLVWEWRVWDHLIQDYDPAKPNYGVVANHPERVDLNFAADGASDWLHTNAIDHDPELDQIVVSLRNLNELWVIDHSTTSAEAATHGGGLAGMGGDLLYRWGNPRGYDRGDVTDQQLFFQHDTNWIDAGLPGAGNILMFNNGVGRPAGIYSSADEIVPPLSGYNYTLDPDPAEPFGPSAPVWIYTADPPTSLYSSAFSSAQRLPNGNTLVVPGRQGELLEVTPANQLVWHYVNPVISTGPLTQGDTVPNASSAGLDNQLFKARRYPPDYPGLAGRDLTPVGTVELYDLSAELTLESTDGGSATNPGEGDFLYGVGQLVTVDAVADPCWRFDGWTVEAGAASIADPTAAHATFTMENEATTLRASFSCDPACEADSDGICGDVDNCASVWNPGQLDLDSDGEGDLCDLDDGLIYLLFDRIDRVEWQEESGFDSWNCYRGDLAVLRATGVYTQVPGPPGLARRSCDLTVPQLDDDEPLDGGLIVFYLTSGKSASVEGGLGVNRQGIPRANDNPCP